MRSPSSVHITSGGAVQSILGNLGAVTIDYKPYDAQGWTIDASEDGHTGHGMFVRVENVNTF